MRGPLRGLWQGRAGTVDWEFGKEMVMAESEMARAESEMVSEGKTLASDRCGRGLQQGLVWKGDMGVVLGYRQEGVG